MEHPSHPVESHWRTSLRNRIIQASSLLEVLLSGLVLIGLLLSVVPLIRWMPGLLFDGNEAEIRTFLERSLDIVIGIEFIKMLAKHSPGSPCLRCAPAGRSPRAGSYPCPERHSRRLVPSAAFRSKA